MSGPPLTIGLWALAGLPIALLFVLVMSGKVKTRRAAWIVLAVALVAAALGFGADAAVVSVALGKGLWLGAWILGVMIPALLLYRIASAVGLERIGTAVGGSARGRTEILLAFAWLVPSFVQGVAGFGTPIAVAAPLLLAMGWSPVRAVALPLVGYHWSVTFGSMGSSFYMASFTAGFGPGGQDELAMTAAAMLSVNCLVAGALVLLMDGGLARLREGAWLLLLAWVPMCAMLITVARVVPAVATLSAATVGLAVLLLARRLGARRPSVSEARPSAPGDALTTAQASPRGGGPDGAGGPEGARGNGTPSPLLLVAPYLILLGAALAVLLPPPSRAWVSERLVLGPSFPSTETALGWQNPAVDSFTPWALLAHPGSYILLACAGGYLVYRMRGLWTEEARAQAPVRTWARSLPNSGLPVLLLASLAMLLVDSGMISVLARGVAEVAGGVYPVLSPAVGAVGSFMTGSTTSSNALFAALQADIAGLIDVPPPALIAAQTVGGNVGNSLAPVVAVLGATAVAEPDAVSAILRRCLLPVAVLLAVTASTTLLAVAILSP